MRPPGKQTHTECAGIHHARRTDADRQRLLLIEDADGVREVLAIGLVREHYTVAATHSAREAAKRLAQERFDLVLLDMRLPDGSGLDLLKRIRRVHSALDLPVIVISGLNQSDDVVGALAAGANDYVTKPFALAVVLARVRMHLTLKRLKQSNDRFLQVASHDLKKPVLLMLDVARQLRAQYPAGTQMDEDGLSALALLLESGGYMQQIIEDLLELRAIRGGRLQLSKLPTDLGAIVRQAVARNTLYAQSKGVALRMRFERDLPTIRADDARLMQVLENLIGNAIKFAPCGSQATVSTRRAGQWLVCEVNDTGPGIPEDEMDKLFTDYAQLSNCPTGGETSTGLGLAISRELILLHEGEIGARNNAQGGATFWFRLPIG